MFEKRETALVGRETTLATLFRYRNPLNPLLGFNPLSQPSCLAATQPSSTLFVRCNPSHLVLEMRWCLFPMAGTRCFTYDMVKNPPCMRALAISSALTLTKIWISRLWDLTSYVHWTLSLMNQNFLCDHTFLFPTNDVVFPNVSKDSFDNTSPWRTFAILRLFITINNCKIYSFLGQVTVRRHYFSKMQWLFTPNSKLTKNISECNNYSFWEIWWKRF